MTTEIEFIARYVWLPIIGLLGWVTKTYFGKLEKRIVAAENAEVVLQERLRTLEMDITKNYYDKLEIKLHIVDPLQSSIRETRDELKTFASLLTEIHRDMGLIRFKVLEEEKGKNGK